MTTEITTIRKSAPNGHRIRMIQYGRNPTLWVEEYDDEEHAWDCDAAPDFLTREAADAYFDMRVKQLQDLPNWDAQARYDAEHGTDNGYDPQIMEWQAFHDNEREY